MNSLVPDAVTLAPMSMSLPSLCTCDMFADEHRGLAERVELAQSEPRSTPKAITSARLHPNLVLITANLPVYTKTVCLYITAPASSP